MRPHGLKRPEMVEKAIPIKDKVQEALLNDKFNFVVVVKNPYSWYYCNKVYSEKIKKDGQTVLDKGYIDWYNERNNEYYQYYKTENKNTFIVRYEDFYYGGYPNVLKNIGDKFNLSPKQLPFKDLDGVVGFASTISPPGKHDMKKYEDRFYLDILGTKAIKFISKHVDKKLMKFFDYQIQ